MGAREELRLMKIASRTQSGLGRSNRRAVVEEILCCGPLPRSEIAERTGLTNAAVSRITRNLVDTGIIKENMASPRPGGTVGRVPAAPIEPRLRQADPGASLCTVA